LEDWLVGFDGDGGWSLSNGGSEVSSGVLWDGVNFRNVNKWGTDMSACSILGGVSIGGFSNLSVLLDVVHGI